MPHHERDGGPFASFDHCVSIAQVAGDRLLDKYCATSSRSGLDSWPVLGFRRSYNHRVEVTYTVKQGLDARISLCAHLLGDLRRYFGARVHYPGHLRVGRDGPYGNREGTYRLAAGNEQGNQKLTVGQHEREQPGAYQAGQSEGKRYIPKVLKRCCSLYPRGVVDLLRYALEIERQHEHRERQRKYGVDADQCPASIQEPKALDDSVVGHGQGYGGDQSAQQYEQEGAFPAGKAQPRVGVGG